MAAKKELDMKRKLARYYYMQGEAQKVIAQKVGSTESAVIDVFMTFGKMYPSRK